jgi:uncharacterized DUF497 family protein
MRYYQWDKEKNDKLKAERGLSFEQVVMHIKNGDLLDLYEHPNQKRYPGQQILIIQIRDYVFLVPYVESVDGRFLKIIIPSRKATRHYLGDINEKK